MRVTLGIFAHVDAGKTTLSEQLLYLGHMLRAPGRVDHQNAFLDNHPLERSRGITIFSEQADFSFGGVDFTLIDTPGHADFSAEMERCISVLDYALIVVSAVEGVQAHTLTVWRLLRERKLPVFFFLNKLDRPGAQASPVLEALRSRLGAPAFAFEADTVHRLPEPLLEELAQTDEGLLDLYLAGERSPGLWLPALRRAVAQGLLCPVYSGSALQGQGVDALLQGLAALCETAYDASAPFAARVYKLRHDAQGQRLAFLKVLSGRLRPRDGLRLPSGEVFKPSELRRCEGNRTLRVEEADAGSHAVLVGAPALRVGDGLGQAPPLEAQRLQPLLFAQAIPGEGVTPRQLLEKLRQLEEEDPLLQIRWLSERQSLELSFMGPIQLEVLQSLLQERFGLSVSFGPPQILYRETLLEPVIGRGHYEPLRHYAEVHLALRPLPRGSGVRFVDEASLDSLPAPYHSLVRTHVLEKAHLGPLTGSPIDDVEIALLSGRAHLKHTEGGDFRQACYRAIRQGLFKGRCQLLEPYYAFTLRVEEGLVGKVSTELIQLKAELLSQESRQGEAELHGRGPVKRLLDYPQRFLALTKGRGLLSFRFDGYAPCLDADAVIQERAYDRQADRENPADSVFCQKGAGFLVAWDKADDWMHIGDA